MKPRDSISTRYILNDLIKNKGVNLALLVNLVLSAFLMATGTMVMRNALRTRITRRDRVTALVLIRSLRNYSVRVHSPAFKRGPEIRE